MGCIDDEILFAKFKPRTWDFFKIIAAPAAVSHQLRLVGRRHHHPAPGRPGRVHLPRFRVDVLGEQVQAILPRLVERDRGALRYESPEAIGPTLNHVGLHLVGIGVGKVPDGQIDVGGQSRVQLDSGVDGIVNGQGRARQCAGVDVEGMSHPYLVNPAAFVAVAPHVVHPAGHLDLVVTGLGEGNCESVIGRRQAVMFADLDGSSVIFLTKRR